MYFIVQLVGAIEPFQIKDLMQKMASVAQLQISESPFWL